MNSKTSPQGKHSRASSNRAGSRRSSDVALRSQGLTSRKLTYGLISRILPVVVLAVGMMCFLSGLNPVAAQNGSPFNNSLGQGFRSAAPLQPTANPSFGAASAPEYRMAAGGASGIPAVPTNTAVGQIGEDGQQTAEAESEGFQLPGFVTKVMSGGWLMLPLGVCSLIVLALSFERMIALRRGRVIPKPFVQRFTECVEDGVLSYEEATELCKEFDCPVSEVFRAALRRWGRPMFEIEQAVMDAGDRVSEGLKKYLRVFHAISNVAPLIGLLGTVIGMIASFEVISDPSSMGRPDMLASGISTALMTTAGGLAVAIPAYLAYMYFSSKSDRYLGEIERLCQRVIDCISEEGLENSGSARSKKRKAA